MLDAGIGETHVNSFLSALNIPIFFSKTLKRYERIAGNAIEIVAEDSCKEAIEVEKRLSLAIEQNQQYVIIIR